MNTALRFRLALALALSGLGSVGAQVVWSKLFAIGLGHEVTSVVSVVSAVMCGLAVGAALWKPGRFSPCPLRGLFLLELIIGIGALGSAVWIPAACHALPSMMGSNTGESVRRAVTFLLPLLTLLPMTMAMGATLAAMQSAVAKLHNETRVMGWTYGWNTGGAMAGAGIAAFLLMPRIGLPLSVVALSLCHLSAALLFQSLSQEAAPQMTAQNAARPRRSMTSELSAVSPIRLWLSLAWMGCLGLGVEVVGIRALSMVFENTVYSFAIALSCFLGATALGAAIYQRFLRDRHPSDLLAWLFPLASIGVLTTASFLPRSLDLFDAATHRIGGSLSGIWIIEAALGLAVFILPCVVAGAGFSHLTQLASTAPGGIARASAINFLGAAVGAPLASFVLLPTFGFKWSFLAIAFGYWILMPHIRSWSAAISLVLAAVVSLLPDDLRLIRIPQGSKLVLARTGSLATVSVLSDADGQRSLRVSNRFQMGGTAATVAQRRQAHLPLLLHSNAQSALFLGPGTGITLGAATTYSGLRLDAVELVPEVVSVMDQFGPANRSPQQNPMVQMHTADARSFLRRSSAQYDVVVADLFHPAQDGSGALYTQEHFRSVRDRLRPGGLFCQWLPLHQLNAAAWRSIAATFQSVFTNTELWCLHFNLDIPVVGLVGRQEAGVRSEWDIVEARMKQADAAELRGAGFVNPVQVLGCRIAGPDELHALVATGVLNLDAFPRVSFLAPQALTIEDRASDSLALQILDRVATTRSTVTPYANDPEAMHQVRDFVLARDAYFHGLDLETRSQLSAAMDRYFDSVKSSLHFTPAYARLVGVIRLMASADPTRARGLYDRLLQARPDQPLGRQLLGPLFDPGTVPRTLPQ